MIPVMISLFWSPRSYENIWRQINWLEIGSDSLPRTFSWGDFWILWTLFPFWEVIFTWKGDRPLLAPATLLDFPTAWNPGCSISPWMCQQTLHDTRACLLFGSISELSSLSFTCSETGLRPGCPFAFTYTGTNNSFWESCHSDLCDTCVL